MVRLPYVHMKVCGAVRPQVLNGTGSPIESNEQEQLQCARQSPLRLAKFDLTEACIINVFIQDSIVGSSDGNDLVHDRDYP